MKIWTVLLIGLIVAGCAQNPPVQIPDWADATIPEAEITYPIDLPELCEIPNSGQWSAECWILFVDQYEIIAVGNTAIASSNAEALRKTEGAVDAFRQAGKYQQELARFREELLQDERRQRELEKWYYRAMLGGLVAIGVAVQ